MNVQSWCRAALAGAVVFAATAGAAAAQSEMTSKIRLECPSGPGDCVGSGAAQYDIAVTEGNLAITRTTGNAFVGIGTTTPQAPIHANLNTGGLANLFRISNNGGIQFLMDRTGGSGNDWQFSNFGAAFQISVPGLNASIFNVVSNGDIQVTNRVFANGVQLTSSRATKENFKDVEGEKILDALVKLPVTEWSFKTDPGKERHIGPTAEDFQQAFGVGQSTSISLTDANGILIKAIQELHAQLTDRDQQISELSARQAELLERLEALEQK